MAEKDRFTVNGETYSLLISKDEIQRRVVKLAATLHEEFKDEVPVFLCILNGAYVFASDLTRAYDGLCEISFIRLSSYEGTQSTGVVNMVMGLKENLAGRRVVVVEDIIDSGLTMKKLTTYLQTLNPKQVKVVALFTKPENLKCELQIDYSCFKIPNKFIVGYGLDYNELFRNLPAIYTKD